MDHKLNKLLIFQDSCYLIGQFRYIKILTWLRGFRGIKQNKSKIDHIEVEGRINNLFYSPKPGSQVRILIYQNWPDCQ